MIAKENRFIGNKSIERLYKTSRPVRSGPFNIRAKKSNIDNYRLAVVVSKKVSKSAVVRNRIRRRIFECFRKVYSQSPSVAGREIIITVFDESVASAEAENIERQMKKLLQKAGI